MKPTKEMRKKAMLHAESIAEVMERPLSGPSVDAAAFGIACFAASEVSSAVQECIEAVCSECREGAPERVTRYDGTYWVHDSMPSDCDGHYCMANGWYELLYQKQLANKEEAR